MENKKYKWRFQPKGNVKAQVAGECVAKIAKANKGMATAKMLTVAAKSKKHPLHNCFEWDDTVAGRKYREQQAQQIIVQLVIVEDKANSDVPMQVRAFVSVEENSSTHYTSISRAMGKADLRRQIIEQAMSELNAFRNKYSDLKELAEVFATIVKVDKKLNGKKRRKAG